MVTQELAVINPEGAGSDAASDPDERAKGIGGSDVAVILDLSPYKAPLDLYLEKRGLWRDDSDSEAAHWGRVMEPVLLREYARREGVALLRREYGAVIEIADGYEIVGMRPELEHAAGLLGTLVHPVYSWARGHIDAVGIAGYEPSHVVEGKTADSRLSGHWGAPGTDEVPEYYLVQVMWYLMLTGLDVAHLAVLIGGNRFSTYHIPRDAGLIDLMLERADAFWQRVQREDPPDPEPGERGKASLARMYPRGDERELEWTPRLLELAGQLHHACAELEGAESRKVTIENEIKAIMAEATRLNLSPDGKTYIGWKNNRETVQLNWEQIARSIAQEAGLGQEEFAQVVSCHTTTKPGPRVFRRQGFDRLFGA